jgi:hypothetical protein
MAAPSSDRLARRYGGWQKACRAAFGLQSNGNYFGFSQPRPPAWRGPGSKPRKYAREESLEGVRACARALRRRPATTSYRAWVADQARRARAAGKPRPRLADYTTLRRLFGGWEPALAAAAITDADLVAAAAAPGGDGGASSREEINNKININTRAPHAATAAAARRRRRRRLDRHQGEDQASPLAAIVAVDDDALAAASLDPQAMRAAAADDAIGELALADAAALVAALGGSLDWLAGPTPERGAPHAARRGAARSPAAGCVRCAPTGSSPRVLCSTRSICRSAPGGACSAVELRSRWASSARSPASCKSAATQS